MAVFDSPKPLHGVNLSGWLVLEPWVTPSLFTGTGAFDELSLSTSLEASKFNQLVSTHRDSFIGKVDFERIASRGFDSVRLQVPWFVLGADGPMPGPSAGCIEYVDQAFDWAEEYNINVLLVIASAPGDDPSSPASFFGEVDSFRRAMLDVLGALCSRYESRSNFLGISPIDSIQGRSRHGFSVSEGVSPHLLRNFYRDAYEVVRASAGPEPAFVVHDAGVPSSWRAFMAPKRYENVWLDCHLYHYAESMNAAGPMGVRTLVNETASYLKKAKKSGLPVMVGEWSAALPLADAGMTPEGRIALERVYTAGQMASFSGSVGWFFQTWKTEGKLSSWDARIALSSFEKGMFD